MTELTWVLHLALVVGAFVIGAKAIDAWMSASRTAREATAKVAKRKAALDAVKARIEAIAVNVEDVMPQLGEAEADRQQMNEEAGALRAKIDGLTKRRKDHLIVFDRRTLMEDGLYEVTVTNPEFLEASTGRNASDPLVKSWMEGRVYLVAALDSDDAARRCTARFPVSLGYRVTQSVPFRLRGGSGRRSAEAGKASADSV
ncbi:hypothetical protein [Rhodocista pekingensis]|uniref:Uncharacterized protein n=1 Tax=Rhodocista pekingensis TaxID=201185 RepID=A0ABW2L0L8_9PROT